MRHRLMSIGVFFVFAAGCFESPTEPAAGDSADSSKNGQRGEKTGSVSCALRGEPVCELGNTPKLTISLVNQTGEDICLVGCLDASSCKWRYPHCCFEIIGPSGPIADNYGARCGNMNTLREQDFVNVPPGGSFDPFQSIDSYGFFGTHQLNPKTFSTPGTYRIRFVYSTNQAKIGAWAGDRSDAVIADKNLGALFAKVPKVEVQSNEFLLTVVAPGK